MDRRDLLAFAVSALLAGLLALGWDWYTTPHDLDEATPSSAHFFATWIAASMPEVLPPIVFGLLARTRIVPWSILLAILVVALQESSATHRVIYP